MEPQLRQVLLIDDCRVFLDVFVRLMSPRCKSVHVAHGYREGIAKLDEIGDLDLLLTDIVLPDGDGFGLLRHGRKLAEPPTTILATAAPSKAGEQMAMRLGALAYLPKPLTVGQVTLALARRECELSTAAPRLQTRPIATAQLCDFLPQAGKPEALFSWDVINLSHTGALLATDGPLPVGTTLTLVLQLAGNEFPVCARVARLQEPGWGRPSGVGVEFVGPVSQALHAAVDAGLADT